METKTIKLTVLFKRGVEKSYIIPKLDDGDINILYSDLAHVGRTNSALSLDTILAVINFSEIASVEIEVLE
jgi:hypothetical protein